MKWKLILLCLLLAATGCASISSLLRDGEEHRFQVPILVWSNRYVVSQDHLRTSGVFNVWPNADKMNILVGDAQFEITTGRWSNAALVEIKSISALSTSTPKIVEYDKSKDACLTDPTLKDIPCSPDFVLHITQKPNDTHYDKILPNIRQIRARRWINHERPSGPVIAVIDTGINYNHEDLKDQVVGCYSGITDKEGDCDDQNGHGSHVAGTIAAIKNNGRGIAGVCAECKLLAVKFLGANGSGSLYHAIRAIDWSVANGAKVLNLSWGGGGYSEPLNQAIQSAVNRGVFVVAAAGNEGRNNDNYPHYPSNYKNVISVAALDNKDKLASFSNFGKETVHVGAPGVSVLSASHEGGYRSLSGTSMASPHVAAITGAILMKMPNANYQEVVQRIKNRTRKRKWLETKINSGGVVSLYRGMR